MNRREFLKLSGILGGFALSGSASFSKLLELGKELNIRYLNMYSINTGEHLKVVYYMDGQYLQDSLESINHFLRDYRSGEVYPIDTRLLDHLYLITRLAERDFVEVICGYRSPAINEYLRKTKKGVAKDSYHTVGKAIDIRIKGIELKDLRNIALSLRFGGVGYYPRSNFVHIDIGPFRYW